MRVACNGQFSYDARSPFVFEVGREIFRSVDIAGLPAGMYSLELNADGEVLSRKLVIR